MRRLVVGLAALTLVLAACGDDGDDGGGDADPALVELLQQEAGQSETIATCIAEQLDGNPDVDRHELEAIIRGEGTEDIATSNAYGDAAIFCARDLAGDPIPTTTG